jgi:hypothetical protein
VRKESPEAKSDGREGSGVDASLLIDHLPLVAVGILIAVAAVFLYFKFRDKLVIARRRGPRRWWEELDLDKGKRGKVRKKKCKRKRKIRRGGGANDD